jgi:outer membrane protein OmpA-like peptidoglycan-associated protein
MKFARFSAIFAAALPTLALPGTTVADTAQVLRKTVVNVEAPVAIPVSEPLRDRFGLGSMPSVSATLPVSPWALLGLRLRCGFLWNGPPPADPAIKDPGFGGLTVLSAVGRVRPLGKRDGDSRAAGPWVEIGAGPGLTGHLVRAVGEAAVGWNFRWAGWIFGPSARYLRVMQPTDELDSSDAQLALLGLEITIHDVRFSAPSVADPTPVAELTKLAKVSDRDGDGIPDDVDKCPDDPEDKDGFEDEDGCPDPDNDKDGIPDVSDACPNEPETVNGFQDEDGCPDEAPIVVKEGRIRLTEHLLFDTNRARVRATGRPALAAVLNLWKQHPEWDHLIVAGHADRHGPDPFNDWLSRVRAERVRNVLIEMGFPEDKLWIAAYGRKQLRVEGSDEQADQENRRVEFVIVKKGEAPADAEGATQPPARARAGELEP